MGAALIPPRRLRCRGRCSAVREPSLGSREYLPGTLRCQERHSCSDTKCSSLICSCCPWGRCGCAGETGCLRARSCSSSIPQPFRAGTSWLCLHLGLKAVPALCPPASDVQTREEPLKPPPRKQQFALLRSHYTELSPQLILCHLALTTEHFISQTPILPCQHLDESVSLLNHYLVKRWWL